MKERNDARMDGEAIRKRIYNLKGDGNSQMVAIITR